ncbi:MAG: beta-propeller domain-containing protein [Candidatus Hodarchaeaceae archaeon]|nr:beta-propeller domain-containing protein [Candidatus Hodarchaeaceae archaeon]
MRPWVILSILATILFASLVVGAIIGTQVSRGQLKRFSSYQELESFLRTNIGLSNRYYSRVGGLYVPSASAPSYRGDGGAGFEYTIDGEFSYNTVDDATTTSTDFSTTNIQVEGVDEADIVKSDGEYIYVVSGNKVFIIDAYPAQYAKILSRIEENSYPTELFINDDKLIVLGRSFVRIYNVSNRENPVLARSLSFNGRYFKSRMIGDFVYLIVNSGQIDCTYTWEGPLILWPGIGYEVRRANLEITLPEITIDDETRTIQASEIYYFDVRDDSYNFTTIMVINTQNDDEEITSETYLIGAAQNIFVSSNNIYITYHTEAEKTIVHKIAMAGREIEYKTQGEVPGRVLNQFSMDEYQGYFRIATTTGEVWRTGSGTAKNHVYVLGEDLNIIGRLEGLAKGERIYSARFMGTKAYLVTFKKVDPLFVIDLSDPRNPKVLGELKIPGYSDYLHPYDETHLIGVGKDTEDAGSFAWFQGVKIALFDVSDPENPREVSKYVIGERGTDSYALYDHRAFLFSRSKNLLVVPVSVVEDGESSWGWGQPGWQGAYVFRVSLEDGLVFRARIIHYDDRTQSTYPVSSWSNCPSRDYSVKRSLYIDDVLYTISGELVKMNDLANLGQINRIELR